MDNPNRSKFSWNRLLLYGALTVGSAIMIFPFLWMVSTSFKTQWELYDMAFLPQQFTLVNYRYILERTLFTRWYINSLIVVACSSLSVLTFDSLVGYTFAKLNFRFKKVIFIGILSTLMIPTEMLVIPWYIMSVNWGWRDSYWGIMFPGMITAFGIFLMKQFMEGIPTDLLDAARIDGLNEFGIFWRVAIPQVKPAISALLIFNFLGNWNAFLWPVIVIESTRMRTLPVGMSFFSNELETSWHLIMTAATGAVIPVIIVFLIFQKQIIKGVQLSGLKG